jgi:hypothetical protein
MFPTTDWRDDMAPVIRISDHVFRRLQQLSVPLVDTPNSVIQRLLDQVGTPADTAATKPVRERGVDGLAVNSESIDPGLFLAPASTENLEVSVAQAISLDEVRTRLDPKIVALLRSQLGEAKSFHCWAMTSSSRATFDKMHVGDIVLFTPRRTGRFTYRATVSAKLESQQLGDLLWRITPGKPWSLIYLLEGVRRIDVDKERLVAELGYDRSFRVYGITRVEPARLKAAIARRGTLEAVLSGAALA